MKIMISKNKDNQYYTKIANDYNNEKIEMYLNITLGKNVNELEYGLYEVDGFLSCYKSKDGSIKPKLVITSATSTKKKEEKVEEVKEEFVETDPFKEFGESIEIEDNFLD
ncbi:MAG: hypothetical protein J6T74_08975 [Clostridia bacterium]|nr:hypothetical protein [Clostridia bacterium]